MCEKTVNGAGEPFFVINLPNGLTFLRIFFVFPLLWLLLNGPERAALALFLVAAMTDWLDGWIAKRFGLETRLGKILDPLADKLLLISCFIALTLQGAVPLWFVLLVVARNVMVLSAALFYQSMTRALYIVPLWFSKFNTFLQVLLITLLLLNAIYGPLLDARWLLWPTVFTTTVSGFMYVLAWSRRV